MRKLLLFLLLFCSASTFAATRTATTSGNWFTAATWGGTVPLATDVAIIPTGITVTVNVGTNGNQFNAWNNAGHIKVSGKLVLAGTEPLFSNPFLLEVLSGGELVDQSVFNQLYFTQTSELKVFAGGKLSAIGAPSIIYNGNGTRDHSFDNNNEIGPFTVTVASGQVNFSPSVLPLKLVAFTGKKNSVNNVLNWQTADEVNTDAFLIERSSDGLQYESLGKVATKGSAGDHHYTFTDRAALKGNNFYRLKMTDLDGSFTYSDIIVNLKRDGSSAISVYPSPAKDNINIITGVTGKVTIYSIEGKRVLTQALKAGNSIVDVSSLKNGVYFIEQAGQKTSFLKK
ncbi:hypothetical protein D3C87_1008490 [compost metagenome]